MPSGFDIIGQIKSRHFYRFLGKEQRGNLSFSVFVTDFADQAWQADVAIASLTEVQYDYAIEDDQLYKWLQPYLERKQLELHVRDAEAYFEVTVNEGGILLEVRIPPEESLRPLKGVDLLSANQALAQAMYAQLRSAKDQSNEAHIEESRLKTRIAELEEQGTSVSKAPSMQTITKRPSQSEKNEDMLATPVSKKARTDEREEESSSFEKQAEKSEVKREVDPMLGRARVVQGRGRRGSHRGFGRLGSS